MLRNFPIMDPGASRNKRTISLEMANIGGGDPRTIWVGNFIVFTQNIHKIK